MTSYESITCGAVTTPYTPAGAIESVHQQPTMQSVSFTQGVLACRTYGLYFAT